MKAFIHGLEVPFKDLGEPTVTFEGEEYNIITDQTGAPYIHVGDTTAYIEFQDDEGKDVTPGGDEPEPDEEVTGTPEEVAADNAAYADEVIAEVKAKAEPKVKADKPVVKDPFMLSIEAMLNARAAQDELFVATLAKPNKSLKECCDYIYKEVKRIGRMGYTDAEILAMAVHYYDEDDIKPGSVQKPSKVIVNTPIAAPAPVELTAEQKEEARKLVIDRAIKAEADRLSKKKAASKPVVSTEVQQSLF